MSVQSELARLARWEELEGAGVFTGEKEEVKALEWIDRRLYVVKEEDGSESAVSAGNVKGIKRHVSRLGGIETGGIRYHGQDVDVNAQRLRIDPETTWRGRTESLQVLRTEIDAMGVEAKGNERTQWNRNRNMGTANRALTMVKRLSGHASKDGGLKLAIYHASRARWLYKEKVESLFKPDQSERDEIGVRIATEAMAKVTGGRDAIADRLRAVLQEVRRLQTEKREKGQSGQVRTKKEPKAKAKEGKGIVRNPAQETVLTRAGYAMGLV